MVEEVLSTFRNIEALRAQIEEIKGVIRCEKCGTEIAQGTAFCSNCGSPAPKPKEKIPADCFKCASCGAIVKKGIRFCTSCGTAAPVFNQDKTFCTNCGSEIANGASFCVVCGASASGTAPAPAVVPDLPHTQPQTPASVAPENIGDSVPCSLCGAMVTKGFEFCTSCGAPMPVPAFDDGESTLAFTPAVAPSFVPPVTEVPVIEEPMTMQEPAAPSVPEVASVPVCPSCGNPLEPGTSFCTSCGRSLSQSFTAPSPVEEPFDYEATVMAARPLSAAVPAEPTIVAEPAYSPAPSSELITCSVCGEMLAPDSAFCTSCGTPVSAKPAPAASVPAASSMTCPSCGAEVEADMAFCTECGCRL